MQALLDNHTYLLKHNGLKLIFLLHRNHPGIIQTMVLHDEYVGGTWRTVTDNGSSLDDIYVKEIGDTMTGELILYGNPAQNLGATPKQYVDTEITNAISGSEGSETGRLDGRYLRKDSAAGDQTVASTGTTNI